jgi:hypothetical protein
MVGLALAALGFVASLVIHLATFVGGNTRQALPEVTQVVQLGVWAAMLTTIGLVLFNLRRLWVARPLLPNAIRNLALVMVCALAVYQVIGLLGLSGANTPLLVLRHDAQSWMLQYFLAGMMIVQYGLGRGLAGGERTPAPPVGER